MRIYAVCVVAAYSVLRLFLRMSENYEWENAETPHNFPYIGNLEYTFPQS